ncbi:MAG: DUF4920 domain-containing protein [Crocinitomicaceae bacterium]
MKTYLALIAVVVFAASCGDSKEMTGNSKAPKLGKSYGPVEVAPEKSVGVDKVMEVNEKMMDATEFTFEGEIVDVCAKAGCWVNVDAGNGETFMVRFKDHFTIPPGTEPGTKAYFHGTAFNDTVSVDMLRHFAEDAGKSPEEIEKITDPEFKLGFTADGIVLQK